MEDRGDKDREERLKRIAPHLTILRNNQELKVTNKPKLLYLMQDLKDEGNTLFKEEKYKDSWHFYCFALLAARQLERSFYHQVEKEFLATLFCNASLCCLKIENYEEALKDADMALCCQEDNIKAMYRKVIALKGLHRYKDALDQAKKGQALDQKNSFASLIEDLKQLLRKSSKGKSSKSAATEVNAEWLEGTNSTINEKKKNMPPKTSKKKKAESHSQVSNNQVQPPSTKNSTVVVEDAEIDSDSTNESDNDSLFASRWQNVTKETPAKKPTVNNASGGVPNPLKPQAGSKMNSNVDALDGFTAVPGKSRTASQNRSHSLSGSLIWPLDGYDFCLACCICFVKEREGVKGYKYRENHPHNCSHDVLIVRDKSRPMLDWLKIRLRFVSSNNYHTYKYKMCMQFQNHLPCRLGEINCTFAHNHAEVTLWNLDRDRVFSIQGFINDAKRLGITSSEDLIAIKPVDLSRDVRYIPGLNLPQASSRRMATPPISAPSPPPQNAQFNSTPHISTFQMKSSGGYVRKESPDFSLPPSLTTRKPPSYDHVQTYLPDQTLLSDISQYPQNVYITPEVTSQQPLYTHFPPPNYSQPAPQIRTPIQTHSQSSIRAQAPSVWTQAPLPHREFVSPPKETQSQASQKMTSPAFTHPPPSSTPSFSHQMPNLNKPPPLPSKIMNPFPQYKFLLFCPSCLVYTGKPWYYISNNVLHQCPQSILAYYVQDNARLNCWVKVRERVSHRNFKGHYVLCNSYTFGKLELCKFKDNCSFAHNVIEQQMWKLEQMEQFDISEFILQNRTNKTSPESASNVYHVKSLLDKFGGYFRFICRDCFFARQPMISSKGQNNTCSGAIPHYWEKSRIVAHVKNTTYIPIDERKFFHTEAFYLMCKFLHFCKPWLDNKCRFAHSQVEKAVWMLERDTKISKDELVTLSVQLFQNQSSQVPHPTQTPPPTQTPGATSGTKPPTTEDKQQTYISSINLAELCRSCWGQGQRSKEDGTKDKCLRGHSNFKVSSVFIVLPAGKEIRSLPGNLRLGMKPVLCVNHPKCSRTVCTHPHGQEELDIWMYMLKNKIKTLRELCNNIQEAQKNKTRKISVGESVINVWNQPQSKPVNKIVAPGDLHISEHYCTYCGISCNGSRQWDDHCMTEKHINNVNSDKEHQWNFRQPPWGQGSNMSLCVKHLHNQSCQYSHVPDMYNLCKYAHSQEELDEWLERYEWRQLKRMVAKDRHMFSYTETLLEEYYSNNNSVNIISESLPGVEVICNEEQVLYKNEKNAVFTWIFQIYSQKSVDKVALLHNKDRLHFHLLGVDDTRHQIASGDLFHTVNDHGNACYKVIVSFSGGMFGSFSQWVVFDFGDKPVLVRKLLVEIGDHLQHERVKELRENLSFDRWTSLNRKIHRTEDATLDDFTIQLLNRYKEPTYSEEVVNLDSLTELNRHNYVHKMHKLLQLEEFTRHCIISSYNIISNVTAIETLIECGIVLRASGGGFFIKVILSENLTEDTLSGKLLLNSVRTVLLAPVDSQSKEVYEATIVGENNYNYDSRAKEYIYIFLDASTAKSLNINNGKQVQMEIQFQMDRKFFCRMHYALDSLVTNDVIFPDVVRYKPDINQLNSSLRIRSNVLNEDQMTAVRHIVTERNGYTPPFIMYGPFGTGKTETLAQATMTLLKERPKVHILICTQSNSAADLYITKHFDNFFNKNKDKFKMLRLNAEERKLHSVPKEVLKYSYAPNRSKFEYPPKQYIEGHNVVLTTIENSMQLTKLGFHNFFTHIFIDEAGQALECEVLMPLTLATEKTCVVLTGDHHQIGPSVYSQEARKQKFDVSILVRLYNYYDQIANCGITHVVERSQQSPLNIFLSINYRTKPEILRFISSVFYGGPDHLKAYGQVPSVMNITPLMFYAVQGAEKQHEDSISYLNHAEAQEVLERVQELVDNWPEQWGEFSPNKLAVISFYSDQIKHIRKMFRQDKKRPYLSEVDIGSVVNFQGKEVRALFISTVRTSNLLLESHIIRSLEDGNDIGDLGFLSNPKLLNTALTRTQSFVAIVGDPIALCLIGECITVWRTYVKHCSNMKSMLPQNLTYDYVRNQVISFQMGPSGRVVEMISKCSQDKFKQSLQGKSTKPQTVKINQEPVMPVAGEIVNNVSTKYTSGLDKIGGGDKSYANLVPDSFEAISKTSISTQRKQSQSHQFENDKLSLSSDIICDDIFFQLAKENKIPGEADETNPSKPEGFFIEENDGFAILKYNSQSNSKHGPYTVTSEDKDFIAFSVIDEDLKTTTDYENWSIDTLQTKLDDEPELYVKCMLHVDYDRTFASVIGPLPSQLDFLKNVHEIEIPGQLNKGRAFNGDIVVVKLLGQLTNGQFEGQVKGILKRALNPDDRLFVCTADPENSGILTPINPDMPRIYCLTSAARIKLARKGNICVYKLVSKNCIEFSHYESIDPVDSANCLFIVRYLTWEPGFLLPLGVVVGMLSLDDSLDKTMQVLEIEHNVKRTLRPQALDESQRLFPQDFSFPSELLQNRRNITHISCFTISSPETKDIEMAISVSQSDANYEVGIHVTDVVAYVDKDSILDLECEHRGGASLFPLGSVPKYMLPQELSSDICSLKPGVDRLAISVIFQVTEQGTVFGLPDVFRSIIKSQRHFSHSEVEDIVMNSEDYLNSDYLKSCVTVLYKLSYVWRNNRLGNSSICSDIELDKRMFMHSHLMLNEVKICYNTLVAQLLLSRFEETTPLLIQPAPEAEKLEEWKKHNASHAFNSIPLTRAFLEGKVCRCERVCTCVFSYLRKHHIKNSDYMSMLKECWLRICDAVGVDDTDFEKALDLISNPENMPQIAVSSHKLQVVQQPERYVCSQDITEQERKHYGLCVTAYTNCTSPLRRFVCMVVQRLLVAYIEGATSPYKSVEIEDVCAAATATEREVKKFNHGVFVINLAHALMTHPVTLNALVENVTKDSVAVSYVGISSLSQEQRTIQLSDLSPVKVSSSNNELQGKSIQMQLEERVYEHHAVPDVKSQYSSEINLDSDRFVCNISTMHWQRLLIAVREKDEAAMAKCVQEITKDIGGAMELLSKSYPEVLSDINRDGQIRHFVPFSFTLHEGQVLRVQLSVQKIQRWLVPSVQLINLSPCLDVCLEHKRDPSNCFANSSLVKQSKTAYTDETKYVSERLIPVLALESAHRAVQDGDRLTIHSINIGWRIDRNVVQGDVIEGNFILSEEFCSRNSFQPDLVSALLEGRPLFNDDPTFSLDYLCVRYKLSPTTAGPGLHESVAVLVNNGQPLTWVGHCRVTAISKSSEGYKVKILLVEASMKMPDELLSSHLSTLCTIEWIRKTWDYRVIDVAVRGLESASSFAKEVVTGRKPFNTIDPVPQDMSGLKNSLFEDQQAVIADSYRQPVSAILGGPGTGKSLLAASLAHLLVGRNQTADAFRQIKLDGYTTQLMICAPNEKSLDVITGFLKNCNTSNCYIVRVYSEEVEERDFPLSQSPRSSVVSRNFPDCAVMKEVALHHLIRGQDNPESKTLQAQEMMKMYGKQITTAVDATIRKAQTYELKKAQIILCTCITSARTILRQTVNIKQLIVDDAGYISEAETIVPLVMHRGVNQLVLFGDLKMPQSQIKSHLASQLGLSKSLLQRYREKAQKLTIQYRCPSTLCSFPSEQFYDNDLKSSKFCLHPPVSTIPWPGDAGFSSVFCHVTGQESVSTNLLCKHSSEDDIINTEECHTITTIVGALVQRHKVNIKSLLVLTMTNAQASLIRDHLPCDVAVSSVLDSIGSEAEYVVLSTVRTLPVSGLQLPLTSKWTRDHLGRLADPQVVNLATTRAKSAFFIVGKYFFSKL